MLSLNLEDIKVALRDLSEIFRIVSFIFLVPLLVTMYMLVTGVVQDTMSIIGRISMFLIPALILYLLHLILKGITAEISTKTRHAMISVALGWLIIALVGSLPYILSDTLTPIDAFFESMSGWTTTGMTMIKDIESIHEDHADILFYRSLTQWVGGVGIIVMALVVFMRKGTVAMVYYSSERGERRIKPSIRGTIIETWKIYTVYTIACMILLYLAGMTPFDAITHSFSALSTGGFSTHTESIAFFYDKPLIEPILIIFMLIGAISFLIHFRIFEGNIRSLFNNIEFRYMLAIISIAILAISSVLYTTSSLQNFLEVFRETVFQSVAAMTCTGFSIVNIGEWPEVPQTVLMILMYLGGIYGSTAGGIKLLRLVVIVDVIYYSMKKLMLPRTAILRIKLGDKSIGGSEIFSVFGLSAAYLAIAIIGALLIMITNYNFNELQSMYLSLSAMGNVGLTDVSGSAWFGMSVLCKIILALLMWIGRLEIFPVLILFTYLFGEKR